MSDNALWAIVFALGFLGLATAGQTVMQFMMMMAAMSGGG